MLTLLSRIRLARILNTQGGGLRTVAAMLAVLRVRTTDICVIIVPISE